VGSDKLGGDRPVLERPVIPPLQRVRRADVPLVLVLAITAWSPTLAQQPGAATRKGTGVSLAATLKYIADTLNQQGAVSVAGHVRDDVTGESWDVHQIGEVSRVKIDPATCHVSYHWKALSEGEITADGDLSFLLGDVQDVELVPMEQVWKRNDVRDGSPARSYRAEPPVLIVRLSRPDHINEFAFYDTPVANRIAQAVQRARKLCVKPAE
jgi:hypothetical protein